MVLWGLPLPLPQGVGPGGGPEQAPRASTPSGFAPLDAG